jgi:hypothetical protein
MPRCPRSTAGSARPEPGCSQRRRRHVAPRRSHPASPSAHLTPCALGQSGDRPRCPRFAPGSPDGARSRRMRHRPAFGTPADRRLIGGEPGIDGVEIAIPDVSITGRQPQHALAGRRRADKNRRPLRTRTARAQLAVLWQRAAYLLRPVWSRRNGARRCGLPQIPDREKTFATARARVPEHSGTLALFSHRAVARFSDYARR